MPFDRFIHPVVVICNAPFVNAIEQNDKTGLVENTRGASHMCSEINAQRADLFEFTFKYYRRDVSIYVFC